MTDIDYSLLDTYIPAVKQHMLERPYQIPATNHAWGSKRCVVDGKPGSGKTLIVWTATLLQKPNRVLILCSKNALHTWRKELKKWFPEFADHYVINNGQPAQRAFCWSKLPKFVACTYAVAQRDIEAILQSHEVEPFTVLIMDEYQKAGLLKWKGKGIDKRTKKRRETQGFLTIERLQKHIPSIFPTSGTTTKKGPQHLWPILHLLNDQRYKSYWSFVHRFCVVVNGPFGKEIAGPQNTLALKETIKAHYHRIPRSETDKYLPKINRQVVPIDMTDEEATLYKQIDDEMWYALENGDIKITSTVLAKITKIRQLLVCPRILNPKYGIGSTFETITDMIKEREDHHVVIFTPFRPAVPILKEYLRTELKTDDIFHVWGGTEPDELRDTEAAWKRRRGVMVATTLFAQSYECETADTCYFGGYECEHTDNEQCEGRLRRTSGDITRSLNAYYIQHVGTYEEHWLDILVNKKQSVKITFQDMEEAKQMLMEARNG